MDFYIDLISKAIFTSLLICIPPIGLSLIAALIYTVIQAATEIHEQSLQQVIKMVVIFAVLTMMAGSIGELIMANAEWALTQFPKVMY
mgnify:CR=1 FL=1